MAYAFPGDNALDYLPCHYGVSRLLFRGPRRSLERPFVAFIGGTETYGKFVDMPFPDLVEDRVGLGAVNLGLVNAGIDVYLNSPELLELAGRAEAVVVQIMGAQNLSNRFYKVHPRRNDRFLGAKPALKALYHDVDFTEFSFTGHMIQGLMASSPKRFEAVAAELRRTWLARMEQLLSRLPADRTLLLWAGRNRPPGEDQPLRFGADPFLVSAEMIAQLKGQAAGYTEAVVAEAGKAEGLSGMVFAPLEAPAAANVPGPRGHRTLADVVSVGLRRFLN